MKFELKSQKFSLVSEFIDKKVIVHCLNCIKIHVLTISRKFGPKMTDSGPKYDPQNYGSHGNEAIYVMFFLKLFHNTEYEKN